MEVCQIKDGWSSGTKANFEVWSVFFFYFCVWCVLHIHCHLVKVYGVCVMPWKQADMVHGFQQWQDRYWQVVTWAPSMSTRGDAWCTDTFSCWRCQRARHSLGSAQNCPGPTGLQRSVSTLGAKESHRWWQSSLYGTVCMDLSCIHLTCYTVCMDLSCIHLTCYTVCMDLSWIHLTCYTVCMDLSCVHLTCYTVCMDLSCIHLTCYTDQREQFWGWNVVNYTKPETRRRMCDRETIIFLQQRK